jgi:hypothetical protein
MPFEVKVIDGENNKRYESQVASNIKAYYEQVEKLGGHVLAGYTMTGETQLSQGEHMRASKLFLVAEIPEASK